MTESFEPYRSESSYELEYDEEPERGPQGRVLWGRVAILGVALLLAFLLGRATGGGDAGVARDRFDEVAAERDALRDEVVALEQQLDAAEEPTPPPASASPATGTSEDGAAATDPEGETEGGETYVIKAGDTLAEIALAFYGDASLDDFIADANDIADPEALVVGDEITIPPEPE